MAETNDLQFLEEKKRKVHVKDIIMLVLRNLHWLILCAAIGGVLATYLVRKQDRVYRSNATIILKLNNSQNNLGLNDAAMSGFSGTLGRLSSPSVRNEILVLKSKTTMMEVVNRLKLNEYYSVKTKVVKRQRDLYQQSPVEVVLPEATPNTEIAFTITPQKDSNVVISIEGYNPVTVKYGQTVISPLGKIIVKPTWYLTDNYIGEQIRYRRTSISSAADKYRYAPNASYDGTTTSVVNISLQDTSPQRAADIINATIEVYNEDVVRDKTILLDYTNNYINERLSV